MKTLITIISTIFATTLFAGTNNDKFYQVTDNGQFQYSYWNNKEEANSKGGLKPVTERTFFLETSKNGLLPEGMTYTEFMNLTVEEKQAIVTNAQVEVIAAMENSNKQNETLKTTIATEATTTTTEVVEAAVEVENETQQAATEERILLDPNAPWLVKAITRPSTEKDLPTEKVEMAVSEKNNELPWTVDVMVNDANQTNAKYIANVIKSSSSLTASE